MLQFIGRIHVLDKVKYQMLQFIGRICVLGKVKYLPNTSKSLLKAIFAEGNSLPDTPGQNTPKQYVQHSSKPSKFLTQYYNTPPIHKYALSQALYTSVGWTEVMAAILMVEHCPPSTAIYTQ